MSGPETGAGNGAAAPAEELPRLVIEWVGKGMADFRIIPSGTLEPAQLYGAAWLLEAYAREVRLGQNAAAAPPRSGLVLPIPEAPLSRARTA